MTKQSKPINDDVMIFIMMVMIITLCDNSDGDDYGHWSNEESPASSVPIVNPSQSQYGLQKVR